MGERPADPGEPRSGIWGREAVAELGGPSTGRSARRCSGPFEAGRWSRSCRSRGTGCWWRWRRGWPAPARPAPAARNCSANGAGMATRISPASWRRPSAPVRPRCSERCPSTWRSSRWCSRAIPSTAVVGSTSGPGRHGRRAPRTYGARSSGRRTDLGRRTHSRRLPRDHPSDLSAGHWTSVPGASLLPACARRT